MVSKREIEREARETLRELRGFTNPERRAATLSYFPSAMENLGVAVPDLRRALRSTKRRTRSWSDEELHALSLAILELETLEGRQLAYELIATRRSLLQGLSVPLNMPSRGGSGDPRCTLAVCTALADDHDEMVAKALSWALRSLIPVDRTRVEDFLAEHDEQLTARVRREVRKKLETGRKN